MLSSHGAPSYCPAAITTVTAASIDLSPPWPLPAHPLQLRCSNSPKPLEAAGGCVNAALRRSHHPLTITAITGHLLIIVLTASQHHLRCSHRHFRIPPEAIPKLPHSPPLSQAMPCPTPQWALPFSDVMPCASSISPSISVLIPFCSDATPRAPCITRHLRASIPKSDQLLVSRPSAKPLGGRFQCICNAPQSPTHPLSSLTLIFTSDFATATCSVSSSSHRFVCVNATLRHCKQCQLCCHDLCFPIAKRSFGYSGA